MKFLVSEKYKENVFGLSFVFCIAFCIKLIDKFCSTTWKTERSCVRYFRCKVKFIYMLVLCSSWKKRIIRGKFLSIGIPPWYINYKNLMLQVKVSSEFPKTFLNYSGNIPILKVKFWEKRVNLSAREEAESL